MKKQTYNPHTWFFAYLKTVDGYGQGHDDVIKESIIADYSKGKTESLSDMYKNHRPLYDNMRRSLQNHKSGYITADLLDLSRKRVIAGLFAWLEASGYKKDINYVKQIACKAAQVKKFNDIPIGKLQELYLKFGKKKEKALSKWVDNVLNEIAQGV